MEQQPPELIILDINLPQMDGYQVCSRLKRDPNTLHIPVIMLTSSDNVSATLKGLQAGVDDFISKDDFATDNLLDTLRVGSALVAFGAPSASFVKPKLGLAREG